MEQKKEDIFDRMMHLHLFRIFEPFYQKNKEMLLYLVVWRINHLSVSGLMPGSMLDLVLMN